MISNAVLEAVRTAAHAFGCVVIVTSDERQLHVMLGKAAPEGNVRLVGEVSFYFDRGLSSEDWQAFLDRCGDELAKALGRAQGRLIEPRRPS